ncbi:histidine phosphatase family protein [Dietzia sp.]|uniref:histidine phosphatase family protein n=1 Tax=Dietzia sp. TaxID=1871616 RepID=UPI002FDB777E
MTAETAATQNPADSGRAARLFLVRHGEFPSNTRGLLDTTVPGELLTDRGREQAAGAAERLAELGCTVTAVHHSPAARARNTAEIIGAGLGLGPVEVPGVFEVQAGELEKRGDAEALAAYRAVTHAWMGGDDLETGLTGGETGIEVRDRAFPQLEKLYREHVAQGRDAVLVIHGTLIRVLGGMLGVVSGEFAAGHPIPNCGIVPLVPAGTGELAGAASWTVEDWAGTAPA